MPINFVFSKNDSDETRNRRTKGDTIEIVIGIKTDEIIEGLFKPLLEKYQDLLEESMKGSEFIFDSVDLLYYRHQKTRLKRIGSPYINSVK